MNIRGIKLVTFDVTNTLLRFRKASAKKYVEIGRVHGVNVSEGDISVGFKRNFKEMWQAYPNFGCNSKITWEHWWREVVIRTFQSHCTNEATVNKIASDLIEAYNKKDQWVVIEGTSDILAYLIMNNVSIGVISNFDPRLHSILEGFKLKKHFRFVLTSYEVGFAKPDARIFEEALKQCNVKANECLHIGDNVHLDYVGAKNAGMHALLVNSDIVDREKVNVAKECIYGNLESLRDDLVNGNIVSK